MTIINEADLKYHISLLEKSFLAFEKINDVSEDEIVKELLIIKGFKYEDIDHLIGNQKKLRDSFHDKDKRSWTQERELKRIE